MKDLERYLGRLILRELEYFPDNATTPPGQDATEVAQLDDSPPQLATGQDTAAANTTAPSLAGTDGGNKNHQPASQEHMDITAMLDAEEEATGPHGTAARLMPFACATPRQRKNNAARQQRIYRLAHKLGVAPGGGRYVRGGRPYLQPAVPRSAVRADGWTVEYNQFMYEHDSRGEEVVVLRMPGGWRRGLVRDRPGFLGVAVVDGFLWPRFSRGMPRSMLADRGKLARSLMPHLPSP